MINGEIFMGSQTGRQTETVEIFWTGGYDSSFRVVQLSKLPVIIRPYYLSDDRRSEQNELDAIKSITAAIKTKADTLCFFEELTIIKKKDRVYLPEKTAAFKRLLKLDVMGSQYEWLSCFAEEHPFIELSIHQDDKAVNLIKNHGDFEKTFSPVIGENFVINQNTSEKDVISLFGKFSFPLQGYTKTLMRDEYVRLYCEDVIDLTWFCHSPINGKSCGVCSPCKHTIEEGLSWRFSRKALLRNKFLLVYKITRAGFRFCKRLFKK